MIVYFLAVPTSETKGGGIDVISCTEGKKGNAICETICEIQHFRTGHCSRLEDEKFICICSN